MSDGSRCAAGLSPRDDAAASFFERQPSMPEPQLSPARDGYASFPQNHVDWRNHMATNFTSIDLDGILLTAKWRSVDQPGGHRASLNGEAA